jgi:hypothetical protein
VGHGSNLNSVKATHSQKMSEAVSVSIWHLPQTGLSITPSLKRCPISDGILLTVTRITFEIMNQSDVW